MKRFKLTAGAVLLAATVTLGYVGVSEHLFTPKPASAATPETGTTPVPTSDSGSKPTPSPITDPVPSATAKPEPSSGSESASPTAPAAVHGDEAKALETLNSFFEPALKGQFPGAVSGLTLGVSTRQDVQEVLGEPPSPGEDAEAFDVYHAEMGNPGYAVSYKLNRLREIRYFGTNVERQTNIGGITLQMLEQNWGKPDKSSIIKNGKLEQNKVVYIRGDYALSFIFNDDTDLDHINLTAK
ncbi:YjgB family protein [Paenibacillus nanensis]|uniref:YjgB family protein n=1 Tax=Paenibacillus nanensis TaxID=393251 RepID=UPI00197D0DC0|nr:YjgB family protein [Paenibacillus nanensis]